MVTQATSPPPHYGMLIDGNSVSGERFMQVLNKYDGRVLGTVPLAARDHVDQALDAASRACQVTEAMAAHERATLLGRVAGLLDERSDAISRVIAAEAGKAIKYARVEVDRAVQTFQFAAEEAKRIHGETIPMDASPAGVGTTGYFIRTPVGVVVAISPFNFPLNLVAHKVAPALAAGNSVVLKPASTTPLSAALLGQAISDAGIPAGAFNVVYGGGSTLGNWLVTDPRVAKITFTGSVPVGERILQQAGIKKVTLELGNNSPTIVEPDTDLDRAVERCVFGSFYNSGQVCISVQRIYVQRSIMADFQQAFVQATEGLIVGDPLDEQCDVGPMIDQAEAERLEEWVKEAVAAGARLLTGGKREGALFHPTVLGDVRPDMKVSCMEAFGPVVSLMPYDDYEEALHQANDTVFGLQAGVFTRDVGKIFKAVRALNYGGVIINDVPAFRADHMPYGGNRQSGLGREGVKYAIEEMTNIRTVVIRPE